MWFTESASGDPPIPPIIGAITTSGALTEFPVPTAANANVTLGGVAAGSDGRLWFTEFSQDSNGNPTGGGIAAITTSGTVSEYAIPTANSVPGEITAGPDGALWFTQVTGDLNGCQVVAGGCRPGREAIARITTTGKVTEFATYPAPHGIASGPDGRIWFTAPPNEVDAITTGGSKSRYVLPGGDSTEVSYGVGDIAPGSDGRMWFTLSGGGGAVGAISTRGGPGGRSTCVVPRLIGKQLAAARRALSAAHCRLGTVKKKKAMGTPGRVLSQRPKPGTKLLVASTVAIVESRR
jgi:virginiamycin B lyase